MPQIEWAQLGGSSDPTAAGYGSLLGCGQSAAGLSWTVQGDFSHFSASLYGLFKWPVWDSSQHGDLKAVILFTW
jgi:hypothetical protein